MATQSRSRKNYSFQERQSMVILAFAIAIQNGEKRWLTPYEIARKIGMTNCPRLRAIIESLCEDSVLVRRPMRKPGRWNGHEYSLRPGTFQEPRKSRVIGINVKGRHAGQMELFSHENA